MNTLLNNKLKNNESKYYSYEFEDGDEYTEYLAPSSNISLMCFPISITAVCCVPRDPNTASLNLSSAVLTPEETQQYQIPWERQQKKLSKKQNRHVCFCWCCMCTCMCNPLKNRVRRKVSTNVEKRANCYRQLLEITRPTTQQIQKWSTSFEEILQDEVGLSFFELFLRQEHSEENLKFWLDVNKFKLIENYDERKIKMKRIYIEFLKPMAPKEINIAGTTRRKIEDDLTSNPHDNVFDTAQAQVLLLMHRQSYPRFLTSDLFNAAIQSSYTLSAKEKAIKSASKK